MIETALDLMARAFTGQSLKQVELSAQLRAEFMKAKERLPNVITPLQAIAIHLGVKDFCTDGYSVKGGPQFFAMLERSKKARALWQEFLILSATMHGLSGHPPQSGDLTYSQTYQEKLQQRRAAGMR